MRKFFVFCLLALLTLGLLAGVVQAAPVDELAALADHFPDTTLFYAAVRTDAGFFEALDGFIGQARDLLPGGGIPPIRIEALLDQYVSQLGQGDFGEAVRPWLGDTAALGFGMPGDIGSAPAHFLLAANITDQQAAADFIETFLQESNQDYESSEQGGYTVLADPEGEGLFAIGEDVLFLSLFADDIPSLTGDFKSLADSADFTGTLAQLPAEDYSALGYMNTPAFFALMQQEMTSEAPRMETMQELFDSFSGAVGSHAFGLTILDGRSFVVDVVQMLGDTAGLEDAGFDMSMPTSAIDPAFATYIPADAPFVMQGTELNTGVTSGFQNLRVFGRLMQQQMQSLPLDEMDEDTRWMRFVNPGAVMERFATLSFTALTGMDLEQDVLPWMDGDFAGYLRLLPLPPDSEAEAMPDFALLVEASDAAGPAALVESITATLEDYEATFFERQEGSLVISGLFPAMTLKHAEALSAIRELDVIVGSSDNLFVVGTRQAATDSLNPPAETLADSPAYQEALGYALDGAQQLWFMNTRAFVPVIETMIARETGRSQQEMREARILAGMVSSGSISAVAQEGSVVARFVLTLAREPLEPLAGEAEPEMIPTVLPTPTPSS